MSATVPPPVVAAAPGHPGLPPVRVHRVVVQPRPDQPDPAAESLRSEAVRAIPGLASVGTARVYLIEAPLTDADLCRVGDQLLADPIVQDAAVGGADDAGMPEGAVAVEVHYKPGVTDPVAQSTRDAIAEMLPSFADRPDLIEVRTAWRYDFRATAGQRLDPAACEAFARRSLANTVVQTIHLGAFHPDRFPRGHAQPARLTHVGIRALDDAGLTKLSRKGHLFLSLEEMRAVRDHYRDAGREPTDVELETLAQTWSEHCVHKTLKSRIRYTDTSGFIQDVIAKADRPGHVIEADGSLTIHNLLKSTIAAATRKLMESPPHDQWCVSVFVDNAGIVRFDDELAVCVKVETHNRPSAIEPYGGSATGIGGCIRDVMGTGLGARPIANTDVFCVAFPGMGEGEGVGSGVSGVGSESSVAPAESSYLRPHTLDPTPSLPSHLPKGILPPRRILQQVVAGVRDYGNRMGIPTVNGAVYFHPDYLGNPLVYCGCVGVLPLDKCFGKVEAGDHIIALGGRTGRDGIHGATFSSAELTDTHADEFSHAVQIGNAITQKKMLDVILQARDYDPATAPASRDREGAGTEHPQPGTALLPASDYMTATDATPSSEPPSASLPAPSRSRLAGSAANASLYHALTDCGAGGFSSAVGEMASKLGATVHLDRAPLKYDGLTHTEIWISEAQERMVLAVPPANVAKLAALCAAEDVEMCDLGTFGLSRRDLGPGAAGDPDEPMLQLLHHGHEVGRMSMRFLHDGIPTPTREARWAPPATSVSPSDADLAASPAATKSPSARQRRKAGDAARDAGPKAVGAALAALLAHPNLASKHWIIRQYDHEVQGGSVVKPLVGPGQDGPSDAAVLRPRLDSDRGIALGCGLQTGMGEKAVGGRGDSYLMTLAAIDEAVRNVVCAGADPTRIAILDNFCWPRCAEPENLGTLVRAAVACYDGALAYRTPFVSGKDSLNNQFVTEDGKVIAIPPTLLITALGIVPDVGKCVTMDAKAAGDLLLVVGATTPRMGGSHYVTVTGDTARDLRVPATDLKQGPANAAAVAGLLAAGLVRAAHDCSDGGLLPAAAEMAFAGRVGLELDLDGLPAEGELDTPAACFAETPSRYLLEIEPGKLDAVVRALRAAQVPFGQVGTFAPHDRLKIRTGKHGQVLDAKLDELRAAWRGTLDW